MSLETHHLIVMWSTNGIESILDVDDHNKNLMISILRDQLDTRLQGNPIRGMIVTAVSNKLKCCELWEVESTITAEELIQDFSEDIKSRIRQHGILLYSS